MMETFQARILDGDTEERQAERIGQLALHPTHFLASLFEPECEGGFTLSETVTGYFLWIFESWVTADEIRRLALMLTDVDFAVYATGGYRDKAFVAECKRIFADWEAAIPNRLEWDHVSLDQHAAPPAPTAEVPG